MEQNRILVTEGDSYGKMYFVSEAMEAHWPSLLDVLEKAKRRERRVG